MDANDRLRPLSSMFGLCMATLFVGCAASSAVEEAPMESTRQQRLRQSLVGTWQKTHVVENGERSAVDERRETWTFKKDGTGTHRLEQTSADATRKDAFDWRLEGRNLVVERRAGGTSHFRADAWSALQMKWFHYEEDRYYVLRPAGDSVDKAPGTRMGPGGRGK